MKRTAKKSRAAVKPTASAARRPSHPSKGPVDKGGKPIRVGALIGDDVGDAVGRVVALFDSLVVYKVLGFGTDWSEAACEFQSQPGDNVTVLAEPDERPSFPPEMSLISAAAADLAVKLASVCTSIECAATSGNPGEERDQLTAAAAHVREAIKVIWAFAHRELQPARRSCADLPALLDDPDRGVFESQFEMVEEASDGTCTPKGKAAKQSPAPMAHEPVDAGTTEKFEASLAGLGATK